MTMLDRMRRHKGWLKWSLGLVVLTFIIFYIPDFLQQDGQTTGLGAAPREVVAEVDGRPLTAGEFQARYQSQVQAYRNQFGGSINTQLLRQLGIDQQVLSQMIDEQVALIEADRHGIRVSDEELAQQIFSLPVFQENGRFIGEARYEQILRSANPPLTKGGFEENLRRSMIVEKLRGAITDWMAVSDTELEREFKRRNEKVKLQVVALTADKFRDKVTVADADIASHFEAHKAEYRIGVQRKIKYVLLDRDQLRQKVAVTPDEISKAYNDNIQAYQTPEQVRASHILLNVAGKDDAAVKKQAEDILAQAKGGADFAQLATKYSEDPGSKEKGGDLDYFSRGRMVPEFEQVAFSLPPGQISDVVKSQFGYHIIKVVDKKAAETRPLDQARPQIEEQVRSQKVEEQVAQRSRQLADRIKKPGDLTAAASENGLTVQESGLFQREDPVPGLGAAPQASAEAFRLKDDEVSGAVTSPRGPVFLTVSGKKDPYVPKLDEVKERVRQDLIRARAAELSRQRAGDIAAALKSAANFSAAAKAQGFEAKDTELIARGATIPDVGANSEVEKVAFSLPAGAVSDPIATSDSTVIVKVVERDEVTPDELRQSKETFRADLVNERKGRFFQAFMAKAKEKLKIETRPDVLSRISAASI